MKKSLRSSMLCWAAGCFVWMALWGVLDINALKMASGTGLSPAPLSPEATVRFSFPWLEALWAAVRSL